MVQFPEHRAGNRLKFSEGCSYFSGSTQVCGNLVARHGDLLDVGVIQKLAEGALDSTVHFTDEDIKGHWSSPSTDHWPLVTNLHLDIELLTTTHWIGSCNQFLVHLTVYLSNPLSFQFGEKLIVEDHV